MFEADILSQQNLLVSTSSATSRRCDSTEIVKIYRQASSREGNGTPPIHKVHFVYIPAVMLSALMTGFSI